MDSQTLKPGQRVQFFRSDPDSDRVFWHEAQFIAYARIDGRDQCIVRTARQLGKPGFLHYMDAHYVQPVTLDKHGNPMLGMVAA